jgi:hypothetical protein
VGSDAVPTSVAVRRGAGCHMTGASEPPGSSADPTELRRIRASKVRANGRGNSKSLHRAARVTLPPIRWLRPARGANEKNRTVRRRRLDSVFRRDFRSDTIEGHQGGPVADLTASLSIASF